MFKVRYSRLIPLLASSIQHFFSLGACTQHMGEREREREIKLYPVYTHTHTHTYISVQFGHLGAGLSAKSSL